MNNLPPLTRDQRKVDADHLKLLAIFHFIGAGLAVAGMLFLFVHYSFMHQLIDNQKAWAGQKGAPPPAEIFGFLRWFYLAFGAWCVVSLLLNLISGFCLLARKHRIFSLVVAGVNCVHVPLGTVLGTFTIIVLLRDSVRELYEA